MASDYQPRSTVVYVTETIRTGKAERTIHWQYDTNKNKYFVPKLGRRVGKHGPQRKAHCTEQEAIRAMYHREEVSSGFAQYRMNLARQRRNRNAPSLTKEQGAALFLLAKRRREASIIRLNTAAPDPTPALPKLPLHANHLEV
jgi:hypothetical protein